VLVVGLLELQPHTAVELDELGRVLKDLHRLGVEGLARLRRGDAHEVLIVGRHGPDH
jgi:hypothetical protein